MKVCIGGTFNVLHRGHKILFEKAFNIAGKKGFVYIGVTKGEILNSKKYKKPFDVRVNEIKKYLIKKNYEKQSVILPIFDKYGLAVKDDFDAIIVSPETMENANEINKKRISQNKKPMKIIEVSYVLADDGKPISSTRILNKEIDEEGKVLS